MKKPSLILLIFLFSYNAFSQCQRAFLLNNEVKLKAMREYASRATSYRLISNGKGIFKIIRYFDTDQRENWLIDFEVDDAYRDNLPDAYAYYIDEVIIIYNSASTHVSPNVTVKPHDSRQFECFQKIIQDRVYIRPPAQDKYFEFDGMEGRPLTRDSTGAFIKRPVPNHSMINGSGTEAWIIYEKDMSGYRINKMY